MPSFNFRGLPANFHMTQPLIDAFQRDWPVEQWGSIPQLLAVSGGADSVGLLRAAVDLSPNPQLLCVAHFNHGWRGAESEADEAFVRDLCKSLDLRLEVGRAESVLTTPSTRSSEIEHGSPPATTKTEEAARKLRYHFLTGIAAQLECRHVLTAHTASDRVETMLHNLCRGTGLQGVCSPSVIRKMRSGVSLVRPLIGCFRWQVEQYLAHIGQDYRMDSSNQDQSYRRNYLRRTILPMLCKAYGPHVEQRLLSFSQIAEETLQSQQQQASNYWQQALLLSQHPREMKKMRVRSSSAILVPSEELLPATWPIVQLAVSEQWHQRGWSQQALSRRHWEQIRKYWKTAAPLKDSPKQTQRTNPKPRINLPGRIRLEHRKGWILLEAI